jgi:NADH:ubiquinone oxidoreductase subunit 4 (subunit M)
MTLLTTFIFYIILPLLGLVSLEFILLYIFLSVILLYSYLPALFIPSLISGYIVDEVSFTLAFVSVILILVCLTSISMPNHHYLVTLIALLVASLCVFTTSSLLVLYIFYEASLIPISYAVLKWGTYPLRGYRAMIMLLFTGAFTLPLGLVTIYLFSSGTFSILLIILVRPSLPWFFTV